MTHSLIEILKPHQLDPKLFTQKLAGTYAYASADLQRIERAHNIALRAHQGSTRRTGEEYIRHPERVLVILHEYLGITDSIILAAALLHDVTEDHGDKYPIQLIHHEMGHQVAEIVSWCDRNRFSHIVDDDERDRVFMQNMLMSAPLRAQIVKLADGADNGITPWDIRSAKWRNKRLYQFQNCHIPMAQKCNGILLPEFRMIVQALKERVSLLPPVKKEVRISQRRRRSDLSLVTALPTGAEVSSVASHNA